MKSKLESYRAEYNARWSRMQTRPACRSRARKAAARVSRGIGEYQDISAVSNVPWWMIGVIHELESGCDFTTHLHNGDSLTARTVNEPEGRPVRGEPPFEFKESALDALAVDGLMYWHDWSIAGVSWKLETFNGFGYRKYQIPSPYLYSGSFEYTGGKFVADHVFSLHAISEQVGALVVLKELAAIEKVEIAVR